MPLPSSTDPLSNINNMAIKSNAPKMFQCFNFSRLLKIMQTNGEQFHRVITSPEKKADVYYEFKIFRRFFQ